MKPPLFVLLAGIVFASLQYATNAQTLTNPSGLRGGPVVPGPVGGFTNPVGGGPKLEPMKIDLTPALSPVPAPTVKTDRFNGSKNAELDAPRQPVPPSPPPESGPDGDAETPEASGTPTVDFPMPTAGEGKPEPTAPATPSKPDGDFPWWILIGAGLLAMLLYRAKRGGRG
jgi:hypothetical protein